MRCRVQGREDFTNLFGEVPRGGGVLEVRVLDCFLRCCLEIGVCVSHEIKLVDLNV